MIRIKVISSLEVISSFLGECLFPWPSSQADLNITRQNVAMPPTPPLPEVVTIIPQQIIPPLINEVTPLTRRAQRQRRRRSSSDSADSDESYTPTRANRGTNRRLNVSTVFQNTNAQRIIPVQDIHQKAKSILTKFAPQFRSAIYNQHTTFETEKYLLLNTQQSNENEELIAKCFITIKESMSLANQLLSL